MDSPLVLDMAIHTFDQARFITGANPISVYCHEFNPPGPGTRAMRPRYVYSKCPMAPFSATGAHGARKGLLPHGKLPGELRVNEERRFGMVFRHLMPRLLLRENNKTNLYATILALKVIINGKEIWVMPAVLTRCLRP